MHMKKKRLSPAKHETGLHGVTGFGQWKAGDFGLLAGRPCGTPFADRFALAWLGSDCWHFWDFSGTLPYLSILGHEHAHACAMPALPLPLLILHLFVVLHSPPHHYHHTTTHTTTLPTPTTTLPFPTPATTHTWDSLIVPFSALFKLLLDITFMALTFPG